jgi:hypothetical protein
MKGKITNLVFYHQPGLTSGYKRFPLPFPFSSSKKKRERKEKEE